MSTHITILARAIFFKAADSLGSVVRVFGVIATSIATFGAYALSGCVQVPVRDGVAAADINAVVRRIKCDLSEVVLRKASGMARLAEAVLRDLRLVSISLDETDDAQVIFETLNGRGAELHATDLDLLRLPMQNWNRPCRMFR